MNQANKDIKNDNNLDKLEILRVMYETLVNSKACVPKNLEEAIEKAIKDKPEEPLWVTIIRFICTHIRDIIASAENESCECLGRVVVFKKGEKGFKSFGETSEKDDLPPELSNPWDSFLNGKPNFGTDPPVVSIEENILAVCIHPLPDDNDPILIYLIKPSPHHPVNIVDPSYIGSIIWTAAQQVLFNQTTLKYLSDMRQKFNETIRSEDIEEIGNSAEALWLMNCIVHEPYTYELSKEKGIPSKRNDFSQFHFKLIGFAMKFSLGDGWQKFSKPLEYEFAKGIEDRELLSEYDLKVLNLIRAATGKQLNIYAQLSDGKELKDVELIDLLTIWTEILYKVRYLKYKWNVKSESGQENKWNEVAELLKKLSSNLMTKLQKDLFGTSSSNHETFKVIVDNGWTRSYLALLAVRAVSNCNKLEALGLDSSSLGLQLTESLIHVVLVTLIKEFLSENDADLWYNPINYTNALINVISWYSHKVIKVDVDIPVADTLKKVYKSETPLYSLKPYYRDHLYHVIDVCMLGHLLLDEDLGYIFKPGSDMDLETCMKQWYVAAIFHDVGYITELLNGALRKMKDINSEEIDEFLQYVDDNYKNGVDSFCNRIFIEVDKSRNTCVRRGLDHGATSAAHLRWLLSDVNSGEKRYRPAIDAIIAHNLHPDYPINQSHSPISALLALCDELQEWGRPSIDTSEFLHHVAATRNLGNYPLKYRRPLKTLVIEKNSNNRISFILKYFPPDEGLFDPVWLWLNKISNFERIEWNKTVADWTIEIKVPLSKQYKNQSLYEMDLLQKCTWENANLLPLRRWIQFAVENEWYNKESEEEILKFPLDIKEKTGGIFPVTVKALKALVDYQSIRKQELSTVNERLLAKKGIK
ncbi:MAG: hypothetical protein GY795_25360 [Desulfobacterales bacterium]|nr:hypothetical protein [Desulfobacterales bacterium]